MKTTAYILPILLSFLIASGQETNNKSPYIKKQDTVFTDIDKMVYRMLSKNPENRSDCEFLLNKFKTDYFNNKYFFKDDNAVTLFVSVIIASIGKADDYKLARLLYKIGTERKSRYCINRTGYEPFKRLIRDRISRYPNGKLGGLYMDDVADTKILYFLEVNNFNLDTIIINNLLKRGYKVNYYKRLQR